MRYTQDDISDITERHVTHRLVYQLQQQQQHPQNHNSSKQPLPLIRPYRRAPDHRGNIELTEATANYVVCHRGAPCKL